MGALDGIRVIDIGLLVVDANEGVMPQTREHVEILELLGIERGLIALTKIDTADPELVELAGEDVKDALAGSFQGRFAEGMMDMVNQNGPYRVIDRFQLTKSGWRSPTIRDRGLESIADFYATATESLQGALEIFGF